LANVGGTDGKKVNAQRYEVFISSVSSEYLFLQDARLVLSHPEIIEPTTSGVNVPYSGLPKNQLSGTILYTTDAWGAAVAGWTALMTKTNQEYPTVTLIVRFTSADGSVNTLTFTSGARLQSLEPVRGGEGSVKVNISFTIFVDPTVS
jgi:hypothetical protein